ncbi:MAG: right-handed parallel beta-helix repeat-containing protein [Victivallales bacterium]|nr:right-handed parallel beta-helix repeat-containing protein [Victivallales bacterium]
MFKIYPVTETTPPPADYVVKINGQPVPLNFARVSKEPYNRRWPGHQRQLDQSEEAAFVSLAADEPLTIEVASLRHKPLARAVVRPLSLGVKPEMRDGVAHFTIPGNAYFSFEPDGRHNALHFFIDPPTDYGISPDDPSVIYYGRGIHEVGMIDLKDGQTLFIDEGAVVFACIRAFDAKNIRILGRGILDNSHNRETIHFEANEEHNNAAVNNATRLHTVQLEYCTNVVIDGITIRDSLVYNIRPIGCRNISISNVKIIGCWRYNSDGIDMHNCENVLIDHCFLRTFDDAVCVKGFDCYYEGDVEAAVQTAMHYKGGNYENFRHVLVRDCVIWNDWGKSLEIGAETRAEEICHVRFENCQIIHAIGVVMDCCNVDYAKVHDIIWSNIDIEFDDIIPPPAIQGSDAETYKPVNRDYQPAVGCAIVLFHPEYSAGGDRRGINENLIFENIRLISNKRPRFYFCGFDAKHPIRNVVIRNFLLNGRKLRKEDYDLQLGEFCENIRAEE